MKTLLASLCFALILPLQAEENDSDTANPESGRLTKQKILAEEKAKHKDKAPEGKKPENGLADYLRKADCDCNGVLSDAECQTFAEQVMKNYERTHNGIGKEIDTNQDGKITGDEITALKEKITAHFNNLPKK